MVVVKNATDPLGERCVARSGRAGSCTRQDHHAYHAHIDPPGGSHRRTRGELPRRNGYQADGRVRRRHRPRRVACGSGSAEKTCSSACARLIRWLMAAWESSSRSSRCSRATSPRGAQHASTRDCTAGGVNDGRTRLTGGTRLPGRRSRHAGRETAQADCGAQSGLTNRSRRLDPREMIGGTLPRIVRILATVLLVALVALTLLWLGQRRIIYLPFGNAPTAGSSGLPSAE